MRPSQRWLVRAIARPAWQGSRNELQTHIQNVYGHFDVPLIAWRSRRHRPFIRCATRCPARNGQRHHQQCPRCRQWPAGHPVDKKFRERLDLPDARRGAQAWARQMSDMQNGSGESEKPERLGRMNKSSPTGAVRVPAGHRCTRAIRLSSQFAGHNA